MQLQAPHVYAPSVQFAGGRRGNIVSRALIGLGELAEDGPRRLGLNKQERIANKVIKKQHLDQPVDAERAPLLLKDLLSAMVQSSNHYQQARTTPVYRFSMIRPVDVLATLRNRHREALSQLSDEQLLAFLGDGVRRLQALSLAAITRPSYGGGTAGGDSFSGLGPEKYDIERPGLLIANRLNLVGRQLAVASR